MSEVISDNGSVKEEVEFLSRVFDAAVEKAGLPTAVQTRSSRATLSTAERYDVAKP
jgi:hypothetical protein